MGYLQDIFGRASTTGTSSGGSGGNTSGGFQWAPDYSSFTTNPNAVWQDNPASAENSWMDQSGWFTKQAGDVWSSGADTFTRIEDNPTSWRDLQAAGQWDLKDQNSNAWKYLSKNASYGRQFDGEDFSSPEFGIYSALSKAGVTPSYGSFSDIGNPANIVKGYADALVAGGIDPTRAQQIAQTGYDQSKRLQYVKNKNSHGGVAGIAEGFGDIAEATRPIWTAALGGWLAAPAGAASTAAEAGAAAGSATGAGTAGATGMAGFGTGAGVAASGGLGLGSTLSNFYSGLGLGGMGTAAATGATLGGGMSALGGGDIVQGALMGGLGGAAGNYFGGSPTTNVEGGTGINWDTATASNAGVVDSPYEEILGNPLEGGVASEIPFTGTESGQSLESWLNKSFSPNPNILASDTSSLNSFPTTSDPWGTGVSPSQLGSDLSASGFSVPSTNTLNLQPTDYLGDGGIAMDDLSSSFNTTSDESNPLGEEVPMDSTLFGEDPMIQSTDPTNPYQNEAYQSGMDFSGGGEIPLAQQYPNVEPGMLDKLLNTYNTMRDPLKIAGGLAQLYLGRQNKGELEDALRKQEAQAFDHRQFDNLMRNYQDPQKRLEMLRGTPGFLQSEKYLTDEMQRKLAQKGHFMQQGNQGAVSNNWSVPMADVVAKNAMQWDKQIFDQLGGLTGMGFDPADSRARLQGAFVPGMNAQRDKGYDALFEALRNNKELIPDALKGLSSWLS
jgi:hypothetical protein